MNLSVKTQNTKGGNPIWKQPLGYAVIYDEKRNSIIVDGFEGFGKDYKPRENANVKIEIDNVLVFEGNFSELKARLL